MYEKTYYDEPTQVLFVDSEAIGGWSAGIAYRDEIICACCGAIFDISEILEMKEEIGVERAIYEYSSWVQLEEEIIGGELPEGLDIDDDSCKIYETATRKCPADKPDPQEAIAAMEGAEFDAELERLAEVSLEEVYTDDPKLRAYDD